MCFPNKGEAGASKARSSVPFSHFHTRDGDNAAISALESLCANASISHYSLDFTALAFLPCPEPLPLISGRTYPSLRSADDESPITRLSPLLAWHILDNFSAPNNGLSVLLFLQAEGLALFVQFFIFFFWRGRGKPRHTSASFTVQLLLMCILKTVKTIKRQLGVQFKLN